MSKNPSQSNFGFLERCPECGSIKLMKDYESAEVVCMKCGSVLQDNIADQGPEWRSFNMEQYEKNARAGAPSTFTIHDKGLSTVIDQQDRDIYGNKIKSSQISQIYRIRKWQRRIRVSHHTERNLASALSEMSKTTNNLSLPRNIFETASVIYRKALRKNLIRGRSIHGISAAAVYIACRQCGFARTLEEVSEASSLDVKELGRSYRFLVRRMDYFVPPLKSGQYISKFSNQLVMQGKAEDTANKILIIAKQLRLTSGRAPLGIAAAACYIASVLVGEKRTQREVAEIAKVTEVTIRNRYKELVQCLQFTVTL